jgi:hypothetical protein
VEQHLQGCAACQQFQAEGTALEALLRAHLAEQSSDDPGNRAEVLARVRAVQRWQPGPGGGPRRGRGLGKGSWRVVAAVALLILFLVAFVWWRRTEGERVPSPQPEVDVSPQPVPPSPPPEPPESEKSEDRKPQTEEGSGPGEALPETAIRNPQSAKGKPESEVRRPRETAIREPQTGRETGSPGSAPKAESRKPKRDLHPSSLIPHPSSLTDFEISANAPKSVFPTSAQPCTFTLRLGNRSEADRPLEIRYQVTDRDGKIIQEGREAGTLRAQTTWEKPLSIPVRQSGLYLLWGILQDGETTLERSLCFAVEGGGEPPD